MKRLALALAAAVLGAGCGGHSHVPATGDALLYWDFLRNAPAQHGTITYDASLSGTGNGVCTQSAVDTVTIDAPGIQQVSVPCVFSSVQGVVIPDLFAGTNVIRVRGWRGNVAVYDGEFSITVLANDHNPAGVTLDVPAVGAHIDILGDIAFGSTPTVYNSCAEATPYGSSSPPNLFVRIRDLVGPRTIIDQATAGCSGALPAPVLSDLLDLDDYEVRVQALQVENGAVVADSCWVALSHFAPQSFTAMSLTNPIPTCAP